MRFAPARFLSPLLARFRSFSSHTGVRTGFFLKIVPVPALLTNLIPVADPGFVVNGIRIIAQKIIICFFDKILDLMYAPVIHFVSEEKTWN